MFIIQHRGSLHYMASPLPWQRMWTKDITKAYAFDLKSEAENCVQKTIDWGYPVEWILTFGAQRELDYDR